MHDTTVSGAAVKPVSLHDLRLRSHLTLRAAARRLNVHHSTLARYEDGTHEPQASDIARMADVYGCTVEDIVRSVTGGVS